MLSTPARRYVPGITWQSAHTVGLHLQKHTITSTFDILDPHPRNAAAAARNAARYLRLLSHIQDIPHATISVKLTQLGLQINQDQCQEHLRNLAIAAHDCKTNITVDMEEYRHKDAIFRIAQQVHKSAPVMLAVQAYLRESGRDVTRALRSGMSLRLVKGVYHEAPARVIHGHEVIDQAYLKLARVLLASQRFHAFGTHDEHLITQIQRQARTLRVPRNRFEFQMLYGVHAALAGHLARDGYAVRVYVPFGAAWHGYVARRHREERLSRRI